VNQKLDNQAQQKTLKNLTIPNDDDILDWIRLLRSENVGALTFHRLIKRHGSARAALKALPEMARQGGRREPLRLCTLEEATSELDEAKNAGVHIILSSETRYSRNLSHLDAPPPLLFAKGNLDLLNAPTFAIVGARNASLAGKRLAEKIAKELGTSGWIIASGLARGIDTAAHKGSLSTGTIAVLAGGVDVVYPTENQELYNSILSQNGLILSESPMGTQPQANYFPRRNRIVSGLSKGVLVVEAALQSGSLITARYANEQGRDVFAIPGNPLDPRARGTNRLIKEGAILTESVDDILNELNNRAFILKEDTAPYDAEIIPLNLEKARQTVLENLGATPIEVDELSRECHLSPAEIWSILLELEIAGRLERHPGGKVSLTLEF